MKRLWILFVAFALGCVGIGTAQVIGPSTFSFTGASQSNVWTCNGGQSSFALTVPSGLTGTFTVTVAQTSSGTYINPPWSYAPGAAAYTNTITNSGSLTVNLGSNQYVKVADTSYSSGSVTVTGVCSSAVAVIPPQPTATPMGTPSPTASGALVISGSWPYTFYAPPTPTPGPTLPPFPLSIANGGTATSAPSPSATATACGAPVTDSGSFPSQVVLVPVCPTASPGPSLPLSVANGGTGTAAPAPTATATACAAAVSVSGSFPSQQVNVPAGCVSSVSASGNLSSSGGTTPAITETNAPTWTGPATANGVAINPSAAPAATPTGYGVGVVAQPTASPTRQPGYIATTNCCSYPQIITGGGNFDYTSFSVPTSSPVPIVTPSPSITLGNSTGPIGAWDVKVTFAMSQSAADLTFICITGTSGTNALYTYGSTVFNTANKICTGSIFSPTPLAGSAISTAAVATYEAQYANGTALTFGCYGFGGSSGGTPNVAGFCSITAIPI